MRQLVRRHLLNEDAPLYATDLVHCAREVSLIRFFNQLAGGSRSLDNVSLKVGRGCALYR